MERHKVRLEHRENKACPTKTASSEIAVGAIILIVYLGFSRGGWVLGGTTRQMDDE